MNYNTTKKSVKQKMDFNSLNTNNFKFNLNRTPNLEYNVQKVNLPGVSLGTATIPTPFVPYYMPGNMQFDELVVEFTVAESMEDWLDIFNWIEALGQPDHVGSVERLVRDNMSDGSLIIMNGSSSPVVQANFEGLIPIALSPIMFDTTITGVQYATASVSFKYTKYKIKTVDL